MIGKEPRTVKYTLMLSRREAKNFNRYLRNTSITAQEFLRDRIAYIVRDIQLDDSVSKLINETCIIYEIDKKSLLSKSRARKYALPRRALSYVLRKKYNFTFSKIGELLGGFDHATIHHNWKQVSWYVENDKMNLIPEERKLLNHLKGKGLL